jgi:hypothetical protein
MKAEQRKELETNALADRMGHLVKRMKTQPRRMTLYYVIGGLVLLIVVFLSVRWYQTRKSENSAEWRILNTGSQEALSYLIKQFPETNQSKAALFQYAWFTYWETGVKRIGIDSGNAIVQLKKAASFYGELAEKCEGDPVWEPEAKYALAVIEENLAIQSPEHLTTAKGLYKELAEKHAESGRGKLAAEWLKNYDDPKKFAELKDFYQEMNTALKVPAMIAPKKGLPDFGKGAPAPKK